MSNGRVCFNVLSGIVVALCASASAQPLDRLTTMWRHQGPVVFAAAASTTEAVRPLCEEILGTDWRTWEMEHLVGRLDPEALERGFDALQGELATLPDEGWYTAVTEMEQWIACYRSLESLGRIAGPEALATAVAMTEAVREVFPRDRELVGKLKRSVGSSLTSGEHTELKYNVATCLSQMENHEAARALRDLYDVAVQRMVPE